MAEQLIISPPPETDNLVKVEPQGVNTPYGTMHIMGTNHETGKVILANPGGLIEATPEELGAWHMQTERKERLDANNQGTAKDIGRLATQHAEDLDPQAARGSSRGSGRDTDSRGKGGSSGSDRKSSSGEGGKRGGGEKPPAPPESEEGPYLDPEEPEDKELLQARLQELGLDDDAVEQTIQILSAPTSELANSRLEAIGIDKSKLPEIVELLGTSPIKLAMRSLREAGLSKDKADLAHEILVTKDRNLSLEDLGRLDVPQKAATVELIKSKQKLLQNSLVDKGFGEEIAEEIASTPINRIGLVALALKDIGWEERKINELNNILALVRQERRSKHAEEGAHRRQRLNEDPEFIELRRQRVAQALLPKERDVALANEIPLDTVWEAKRRGFKLEVLVKAKRDARLAAQLKEQIGLDVGHVDEPERHPDPRVQSMMIGEEWRKEVKELAEKLSEKGGPALVREEKLQRLGRLPLKLDKIPLLGHRVGMRVLAWRIYLNEKKNRDENKTYNDGFTGGGFNQVRAILDELEHQDHETLSLRSRLSRMNEHTVLASANTTARRDLAQKILETEERQKAYTALRRTPDGVYIHGPFKRALKQYMETTTGEYDPFKYGGGELHEYEFLRDKASLSADERRRRDALKAAHPEW